MENLLCLKNEAKATLDKKIIAINNILDKPAAQKLELKAASMQLEENWTFLSSIYAQIETFVCNQNLPELQAHIKIVTAEKANARDLVTEMKVRLEERLERLVVVTKPEPTSRPTTPVNSQNVSVTLPKLDIKPFHGDRFQWREFWELFKINIQNNRQMEATLKFSYLKSYLGGDAKRLIEGLPLTDAGYTEAIEILKDSYNEKSLLVQAHLSKLNDLQYARSVSDLKSLSFMYNELNKHTRALKALGVQQGTYGC